LEGRVHFEGYVPPAKLEDYYLQASVFVMSSLWPEPFGMAGPEAMQYGLPVVAFDAGGIREWLHDGVNGYLVPWKDTDLFAARLETLLGNKTLARAMGQSAWKWVRQYGSAAQIDILEQVFERVLERTATASLTMDLSEQASLRL
jgi:glycosyltransferase involved in cell wall biosynthesis